MPDQLRTAAPWGGEFSKEPIAATELLSGSAPEGLTWNTNFFPAENAEEASQPFAGVLQLDGATMTMLASYPNGRPDPSGFRPTRILGKETTFFPDVSLALFTHNCHLVPTSQNVLRSGSIPGGRSWWDLIIQPGRVWSEAGDPPGWNRAAFPFSLVTRMDGEIHVGLALFLYNESQVSPVRFQVVHGSVTWYTHPFTAWGVTKASYRPGGIDNIEELMRAYEQELADRLPVAPWSELPPEVSHDSLVKMSASHPDADPDVFASAVVHDGVLFRTGYHTAAGAFPYSDEMRHSVWSTTKTAMANVATLRVAQKYGAAILDEPIAKYLASARQPGWDDVTFRNLANMSSGRHRGEGDYTPGWFSFLFDYCADAKTQKALTLSPRTYDPGTEFNYSGQAVYLLGVALDAVLKSKEGPQASAWQMLEREVAKPIGIHHLPNISTIEADGSRGQPYWDMGYFPTLDDLAKLGLLYQNHGAWNGQQILHRGLTDSLLPTTLEPEPDRSPNPGYYLDWWIEKVGPWWLPRMMGYGRNWLTLLPGDKVAIRVGNHQDRPWPPEDFVPSGGIWPPEDYVPGWPRLDLLPLQR